MKLTGITIALGTLALGVASAASSHHFTLYEKAWLGGTELKPGDYKVEIAGDKAVIKSGRKVVEQNVTVTTADKKFPQTEIRMDNSTSGKPTIQEIDLGGTATRIMGNTAPAAAGS